MTSATPARPADRHPAGRSDIIALHGPAVIPMSMHTLEDAFVQQLRELFHGERQIRRMLPSLITRIWEPAFVAALTDQLLVTHAKIKRLQNAFASISHVARGCRSTAVEGLVGECIQHSRRCGEPEVVDALVLAGILRVQSYQISYYGSLCTWAELLGFDRAHHFLLQNLEQERLCHEGLGILANGSVNPYAAAAR